MGTRMVTTRTDDHPIRKASQYLKHHSLLVGSLSMSEWIILEGRTGNSLHDDYDLGQRKGGGAMRGVDEGSIAKMPHQNHSGSAGTK